MLARSLVCKEKTTKPFPITKNIEDKNLFDFCTENIVVQSFSPLDKCKNYLKNSFILSQLNI